MRPPGPVAILYSIVGFSLLHLQRTMASLVPKTHFCDAEICAGLPVRLIVDQNSEDVPPTPPAYINLPINSSVFLTRLLDTAPCPPVPRVQLLCESWSTKVDQLTCEERTQILSKCLGSLPVGNICDVIRTCPFTCKAFGLLKDLHCTGSPSLPEMLPSVSVTASVIMTTYDVNATNGSDWSAVTKSPDVIVGDHDNKLRGEVVVVLIAVCVFGFIFLPLIVYFLLNRDNRTKISRCCGSMWSCCTRGLWSWCKTKVCPTHERFTNEDNKKDEGVEEIVAITNAVELGSSPVSNGNTPARSITSDSGIGIGFDLDFPEADAQTPDEYRNTPWIQRRSLLVDTDFDFGFD